MDNKILATVDGVKITEFEVNSFIQRLGQQQAAQFQNEEGKKHILQELVNQNLFLADAKTNKLEETKDFKLELDKMKDIILTQININNMMKAIKVEDSEAVAYFEANKTKFSTPAKANTSHILVDTEEECNEIHQKILSNEISFEDAAKAHSKCPSKEKGGNLGSFPRGQMVPEFEAIAFELEKDEMSKPVKTQFGYHIIKLVEKEEASEVNFETVSQQVKNDLISQKQHAAYSAKVSEMRNTYTIEMA